MMGQVGAKLGPSWAKLGQVRPKLEASWGQVGPKLGQVGAKLASKCDPRGYTTQMVPEVEKVS
eukprot:10366342-Karenia_brevis.AAC.1